MKALFLCLVRIRIDEQRSRQVVYFSFRQLRDTVARSAHLISFLETARVLVL